MNQDRSTILAESVATSTSQSTPDPNLNHEPSRKRQPGKGKEKEKPGEVKASSSNQAQRDHQPKRNQPAGAKLRGHDRDSPEVRISKTLSWLLRHGAQGEGLKIRTDGYVKVDDLVTLGLYPSSSQTIALLKPVVFIIIATEPQIENSKYDFKHDQGDREG